jgi:uncharacterized protein (DUF58 family)
MIPSARVYRLLLAGLGLAALLGTTLPIADRVNMAAVGMLLLDGLLLSLTLWDSRQVQPVQVSRMSLSKLSIGRENPVILTLQGNAREAKVQIRDAYPPKFVASCAHLQAVLPAYGRQKLTYTVLPHDRGEFVWEAIQVRQLGPWALGWRSWQVPQSQTVAVYPDLIGLRELSIRLTLQTTGNMRQVRRTGMGTEFAELRDYGTGDDLRLVDWKATARQGRPLVRVLEPEQEQTLIILLDRGRLMTARVLGLTRFDWGLKATLSLALAGLKRGDRVGVGVFDRQITTWIPPEKNLNHLSRLLDRLARLQPEWLEPDYFGAATTVVRHQTRRALIVLITDLVDATASSELLAALSRLTPRYLPFCVALRDPEVDRQASDAATDIDQAYARAVALDLLSQRQVAFAQLKQKGVLVLDAPVDQISDRLVEQYLQLKARRQL